MTYVLKCNRCLKWCAKETSNILAFKLNCPSCGAKAPVKYKSKTYLNLNVKQVDPKIAPTLVSNLNTK